MPNQHSNEAPARPDWARPLREGSGSRYLQIADLIETAMQGGSLTPGDRLPSQRQLASLFGVDLTTVTRGLNEAARRGLTVARGSQGTFIALPAYELSQAVDLSMNVPPPAPGIDVGEMLRRGIGQLTLRADPALLMTYHLGGGTTTDRSAGARWLAPMLGSVAEDDVVACPGAQTALAALIKAGTEQGGAIAAEPLIYPGVRAAASQLGRRIVTIAVDGDGMRPDSLEAACQTEGVRLVYLNPTLQNPTTHTMPEARRRDIARVAERQGILIIEDDPYWLLTPDAPPPIATLAPQQTAYVSTLSKCLSPGLRTAYVVVKDPTVQNAMLTALRAITLMASPLATALATQWILDGAAKTLLDGIRTEADARQQIARQWLAGFDANPALGIHIWHPLPSYWTSADFTRTARSEDLRVTGADAFADGTSVAGAIRISLGGVAERGQLSLALKKLSGLLARRPARDTFQVI
jgi:DNA-binding transcriptional MocR family regulator